MNPILLGAFALGLTAMFTAYGAAVRANRLETRGIVGFGTAIGLVATVASYFILSRSTGKPVPPGSLLANSLAMSLCTGFVIAQALRRHRIEIIDEWDIAGVRIVVQQCVPSRILGVDTLIVPAPTRIGGDLAAAGAVMAAAGKEVDAAVRASGAGSLERIVATPGGSLPVERILFAAVHEPAKSVDCARLRRVVDNAVVQARKSGARRVAIVAGTLRGCDPSGTVAALLPAARHAARFEAMTWVALDAPTATAFRKACEGRGDARMPVAPEAESGRETDLRMHERKSP
ncbi:MAG: hypothetical protein ACKO5K_13040 [Armatimonadota bacterium]